jgi:hypothetical protein
MRLPICLLVLVAAGSHASAQHGHDPRFVERTPYPIHHLSHTMDRAGYPQHIAPWAIPGVTRFEAGGYVGGGCLKGNAILAGGPFAATGPIHDGTFGWDFSGFKLRPGRIFLAPSADPSQQRSDISRNYRTEGNYPKDVGTIRPLRRAILEKREVKEERHGGGEH